RFNGISVFPFDPLTPASARTDGSSRRSGSTPGVEDMKGGGSMQARISKRSVLLLAVVAAVLAVSGGATAGSSSVATTRPPNPLATLVPKLLHRNSQQREVLLHTLAAKEGEVDVYTSLSTLITGAVQKAWAARYPDV